jgi:acetyl esterase/lipase
MITLPATSIKTIVAWVSLVLDVPAAPFHIEPVASAEVARGPDGRAITERAIHLGPNALFGVVTEAAPMSAPSPPTVVFLSAGALDHTGAGRMWVELARRLADHGLRCLRLDIDGVGETFGRPDLPRQEPKPPEAIDDLVDLAVALGDPDARDLIFVGLSAGGYHAVEAGLRMHPLAVCAINPGITGWIPDLELGVIDPRRSAYRAMPALLRDLSVKHARVARWTWRALCQVWVRWSPIHPVVEVSRRGTPVLVIVSEIDARDFEPSLYWSVVRRRLHRRGMLDIEVVPGEDHSLYTVDGQDGATRLLTEWLLGRFADDTGEAAP